MPADPTTQAPATPTAPAPLKAEPDKEQLRVAIALNGGVSLAVWMGGCAVELDRARRAGFAPGARPAAYEALCKCFGRRLVLDILTGSSAGGINGGLLSAAMVSGRRLDADFVRNRWLDLGDLGKILQDEEDQEPTSLMDGEKFHTALLETFKGLLGNDSTAPGYKECAPTEKQQASVPSLDVTMTDVIGVERRFRDVWGGELIAREHRPRFEFREPGHFTGEALAAAARTSASFPFAFEPWLVEGNARTLAGLPARTYGIDGGLLDNAPIRAALDLIPTRTSGAQVRRYICYMNADPTASIETGAGKLPGLREVGGFVVKLPRAAPLVDHLYAIRKAVERPRRAGEIQGRLLKMDLDQLRGVAGELLDSYQRRRSIESLEELLTEPGDVAAMYEVIQGTYGRLPWIPADIDPPQPRRWEWGQLPAQRIIHLMLDVMRPAIAEASPDERADLLNWRLAINRQLEQLSAAHADVTSDQATANPSRFDEEAAIARVDRAVRKGRESEFDTREAVVTATLDFRACLRKHSDLFEDYAKALFGDDGTTESQALAHFFRRVLAVEVVRRSLSAEADVESAEALNFIQLTPAVTSPIFTEGPLNLPSPDSAAAKLTGVGLGHFAGFLRRAWRANDFMWGRLDAAARIVDLLLDSPSPEFGEGAALTTDERVESRSRFLAKALLEGPGTDDGDAGERVWLLEEALGAEGAPPSKGEKLEDRLASAIAAELRHYEEGDTTNRLPFTRAIFQRAAQLEIVRTELPTLCRETKKDRKRGSLAKPLELSSEAGGSGTQGEIEAVRELYQGNGSLPKRLTADGEAVSDLGLRTATHASFVGLAALRTAGMPMSKYLGFARPPLLAVAGTVAKSWVYRATVVLGFWAAAIYLTSRLVTAKQVEPTFRSIWSLATLTALVAAVGGLGAIAVPALRLWRGVTPLKSLGLVLALLLAGYGLAAALAAIVGSYDLQQILFTPKSETPPEAALLAVLGVLGVVSLSRLPLPGPLRNLPSLLEKIRRDGRWICIPLILAFGVLIGFAAQSLGRSFDGPFWKALAAGVAFAGPPLAAGWLVRIWRFRIPRRAAKKPRPTA